MSVVFCVCICMANTNYSTVRNKNFSLGIIIFRIKMGGGDINKKVGLRVIAEKLKLCS